MTVGQRVHENLRPNESESGREFNSLRGAHER